MQAGTETPDENGNEIAFLRADPIDEFARKKAHESIEERESGRDAAVVGV